MPNEDFPKLASVVQEKQAEDSEEDLYDGLAFQSEAKALEMKESNIDAIADWASNELSDWEDRSSDFGMGYRAVDELVIIFEVIAGKAGISGINFMDMIQYHDDTTYNKYGEGSTVGSVDFFGQTIGYSSHDDGYGFCFNSSSNQIKAAIKAAIKKIFEMAKEKQA